MDPQSSTMNYFWNKKKLSFPVGRLKLKYIVVVNPMNISDRPFLWGEELNLIKYFIETLNRENYPYQSYLS